MGGNGTVHCPLSRCETEPGYCEEAASPSDTFMLSIIIALPILIALLAPGMARGGRPCRRDDDVRGWAYEAIDPPMFLCGVGLIPLDCGLSGLLTVVSPARATSPAGLGRAVTAATSLTVHRSHVSCSPS